MENVIDLIANTFFIYIIHCSNFTYTFTSLADKTYLNTKHKAIHAKKKDISIETFNILQKKIIKYVTCLKRGKIV